MSNARGATDPIGLADEADLWHRLEDPAVREELVGRYLSFAKSIAYKYRGSTETTEDLVQVASLGLMKAIERFDPEAGFPFVAFASSTINGELKRHFRDRVASVRMPRTIYERIGEVEVVTNDLRQSLRREPTAAEIADYLGCSCTEVLEAQEATAHRQVKAFRNEDPEEDGVFEEHIGAEDESFALAEDRIVLQKALAELDSDDLGLIQMRYGEELSQSRIAERVGCSQMQISRRLRRVLDSLNESVHADEREALAQHV